MADWAETTDDVPFVLELQDLIDQMRAAVEADEPLPPMPWWMEVLTRG